MAAFNRTARPITVAVTTLLVASMVSGTSVALAAAPDAGSSATMLTAVSPSALRSSVRAGLKPNKLERSVFRLTNKARRHGRFCGKTWYPAVPPLSYSRALGLAARRHSADMAKRNYFAHETPEGLAPWDRIDQAGYGRWTSAGENIAAGQSNPTAALAAWLKSPPHCTGVMSKTMTQIGVGRATGPGRYHIYWTQTFASKS